MKSRNKSVNSSRGKKETGAVEGYQQNKQISLKPTSDPDDPTVDSEQDKGATSRSFLPVGEAQAVRDTHQKTASADTLKGKVVLLVDDNPQILHVTKSILMHEGLHVITAQTGREAMEKFQSSPDNFSLVIIDLLMPVMPGDRAALEIRGLREDIGIIFASGYHQKDLSMLQNGPGVTVELEKPFSKDKLLETVQCVLEGRDA